MEFRQRLVLFFFAAAVSMQLFWQGHGTPPSGVPPVAFVRYSSSSSVIVRVKGCVRFPGLYTFSDGTTVRSVINMTMPEGERYSGDKKLLDAKVKNGDIVDVERGGMQVLEFSITKMKARERMLLGIPLNPDEMDVEDWDVLPGVGPALAQAIILHRQNNGEFGSVQALLGVPGIGERQVQKIKKYF